MKADQVAIGVNGQRYQEILGNCEGAKEDWGLERR